jgi:hypothetical protein
MRPLLFILCLSLCSCRTGLYLLGLDAAREAKAEAQLNARIANQQATR